MATDLKPTTARAAEPLAAILRAIRPETVDALARDAGRPIGRFDAQGDFAMAADQIDGIAWATFEILLDDLGPRRNFRLAYDRGRLRFMVLSLPHEEDKGMLGRLVEMLTFERRMPILPAGSTTLIRPDLDKAVEPDKSYWIGPGRAIEPRRPFDLTVDPSPDLAIEIDRSHSSLPSLAIYRALGVPEVWRLERGVLAIYRLGADGAYATGRESAVLPGLAADDLERFLALGETTDQTTVLYAFRDWVRAEFPPRPDAG